LKILAIKSITCYLTYFVLLTQLFGNPYPVSIEGKYCQPDCDEPVSYLLLNPDSSFSLHSMLYGGISRYGNWELIEENEIQIRTTKIASPNSPYQMPPPQIITILSNEALKIGNTLYIK